MTKHHSKHAWETHSGDNTFWHADNPSVVELCSALPMSPKHTTALSHNNLQPCCQSTSIQSKRLGGKEPYKRTNQLTIKPDNHHKTNYSKQELGCAQVEMSVGETKKQFACASRELKIFSSGKWISWIMIARHFSMTLDIAKRGQH